MQLLWNTLVICCTGFVIVIVSNGCAAVVPRLRRETFLFIGILLQTIGNNDSGTTSIKSVSFYIAITLEVFILCFAGEFLSAKVREERINNALILFVLLYF